MGRYLEQSFPLIILGAFVLFDKNIQPGFTRKEIFLAILAALPAYFLLGFKLYPLNNMSLAFLGIITYVSSMFAVTALFLFFGLLVLVKRINFKSFSYFLICFLLLGNLDNFAMIYYSSQQDWLYRDEAVMGRWIDANLGKDDVIGVPVEEHGFCKIGVSRSASILYSGLYFKNKIVCIDGLSDYDYILTANALNHTKLASFGETAIYGKLPAQVTPIE